MVEPYRIIQEDLTRNPWKMMVACILLNQTRGTQVREVLDRLFNAYPSSFAMACSRLGELVSILHPLGLQNRRATTLRRYSGDWFCGNDVASCYGIGQYALDSYRIFILGERDLEVEDKELQRWLELRRCRGSTI